MTELLPDVRIHLDNTKGTAIGGRLTALFNEQKALRVPWEDVWLTDTRQYKGEYEPQEQARLARAKNRSKAFVRLTRTKVKTQDSRVREVEFGSSDPTWKIEATPVPQLKDSTGDPAEDKKQAEGRAEKMALQIQDQLVEGKFIKKVAEVTHSGHKLGAGCLKGPMVDFEERKSWKYVAEKDDEGRVIGGDYKVVTEQVLTPYFEAASLWDLFPEMAARGPDDYSFIFQRHTPSANVLQEWAAREDMDPGVILEHLEKHRATNGDAVWERWENELHSISRASANTKPTRPGRYEALEYWGWVYAQELRDLGVEGIPSIMVGVVQSNVWFFPSSGRVFKAIINPNAKQSFPYSWYIPEPEDGSFFGVSLCYVLRDTQALYNATTRMMIDNAAFAAGPQFEVNTDKLQPQDRKDLNVLDPFRVWATRSAYAGDNTPAIRVNQFPMNSGNYLGMLSAFRGQGDEASGIPSYQSGSPQQGVGRTVGGLSLLMGAAGVLMKEPLAQWDEFQASFLAKMTDWNMQFSPREDIKGDFRVKITGSHTIIAKENHLRMLLQYMQLTTNPIDAPWTKRDALHREIVKAMDLSAEDLVKTMEEMQAELAAQANNQPPPQPGQQPPPGGQPPAPMGAPPPGQEPPPQDGGEQQASPPMPAAAGGGLWTFTMPPGGGGYGG